MKSIGILYICTGPYHLFWEDFYNTFEKYFLKGIEKRYFVFTDAAHIYKEDNSNVMKYELQSQPWPLVTLLRFSTFLTAEEQLAKCDYLLFSNANIVCEKLIDPSEILPRENLGESLFVTSHPGYYGKNRFEFPYERNKKSFAYIPWNLGESYVIGAFFGGTSEAFIKMSKSINKNIEDDLRSNIIAKWHDESHLNRYIIERKDIRVVSPEYCYPFGMNVTYEKRIAAVSKQIKFDAKKFKGIKDFDNSLFYRRLLLRIRYMMRYSLFLRDSLLRRKLRPVKDAE